MKAHKPIRIVEIVLHRSKTHPKFGHAVAILFPCNHKRYLGVARMKGTEEIQRVQEVTIVKFDFYEVTDKVHCLNCPFESELFDGWTPELSEVVDTIDED